MSTYVIGDIQGCFDSLIALFNGLPFDPATDRLWFVGDLVNRGPRSLDVLRWVRDQGQRATTVLGNHDLHLLACAHGIVKPRRKDTLAVVLEAPDREELLSWLVSRPLIHRERGWVLVHAGLHPRLSIQQHEKLAISLEGQLATDPKSVLGMWRKAPSGRKKAWGARYDASSATERRAFVLNVLTRMRCIDAAEVLDFSFAGLPEQSPPGLRPWYSPWRRRWERVITGHWAARGFRQAEGWIALDSGCVWGNALTAYRLEDGAVFSQPALEPPYG